MFRVPLAIACAAMLISPVTASTSSQRMKADIGKPLSELVIRMGPPESIVRINASQVAVTFVKRGTVVTGGGIYSFPILNQPPMIIGEPVTVQEHVCRFTLIVTASRDNMPLNKMVVVGYRKPRPDCER